MSHSLCRVPIARIMRLIQIHADMSPRQMSHSLWDI